MRVLILLVFVGLFACAQAPRPLPIPDSFGRQARQLLVLSEDDGASVGAWVGDAATGETLFEYRAATRFLPASTLKVATTVAALAHLGPEHRFRTPLRLEGTRKGSVFEGRLVVRASGDPSLGSWRFEQTEADAVCDRVAEAFEAQGIGRFAGRIEVESDGAPASMGPGWAWDDAGYAYSAVPTEFVFRENVVDLRLRRAPGCGEPSIEMTPEVPGFNAQVRVETAETKGVFCKPEHHGALCRWRAPEEGCPRLANVRVATESAPEMFEACVGRALERRRITHDRTVPVLGVERSGLNRSAPERIELLTLESPPLSDLVFVVNKESLNLYAERLALELARHVGTPGYEGVASALREDWLGRDVASRDIVVVDGSGLSRYNQATPRALGRVLQTGLLEDASGALWESLPVVGVDGTLAKRKLAPAAEGRVRAKSGSMTGQRAWTGLVARPGDERHPEVVFTLMVSNANEPTLAPNELFERFVEALVVQPMR